MIKEDYFRFFKNFFYYSNLHKFVQQKKEFTNIVRIKGLIHCKNSFGINWNYLSLQRSHFTVRNKGDLDRFIKTKPKSKAI